MNRVAKMMAVAVAGLIAGLMTGCGSDGIEFNGIKQVEQFPVRKTPIVHYNLPSELTDPVTGDNYIDVTEFTSINLAYTDFVEQAIPGHDLWAENFFGFTCTDNPTCSTPAPVDDWIYTLYSHKVPGPDWPDPTVTSSPTPSDEFIRAWTLSIQHQWFLREVNGSAIVPAVMGTAPVQYESVHFSSMKVSIVDLSQQVTPESNLPASAQREAIPVGPTAPGVNGTEQIVVPASNYLDFAFNGQGAPQGMLAAAWWEAPAENIFIEKNFLAMQGVPAPPYFAGGGQILAGGGVYHGRFSDNWQQTTSGSNSTIDIDDGVQYSYYLATVANHLIGYGSGLIDSAFALPGVVNNQEDIMNQSVVLDMTAFIAAGKEFQFVVEDLLRMQDTVNGDYNNPGPLSTLPGTHR